MSGVGSPTSPAAIEVAEKQAMALNLRRAGTTFEEIANQLGYASAAGAHAAVKSALAKTLREPAAEVRELELARLDNMLESISEAIMSGDLNAIATALRISERRSRLLGLDLRERPLSLTLPNLDNPDEIPALAKAIFERVVSGDLLMAEAEKLISLAERVCSIITPPDSDDFDDDDDDDDDLDDDLDLDEIGKRLGM